ncbi:16S rRNA (cytosine967-C5)-methyltransferase [Leucobacter chromiiresistens]|uniref:16S rRNA (Cytosine967-C5)-methyltransferase n=3 Tax=Leucobacter chromiiresistens TaxID=1079994 RepID=A0A1H0ZPB4_9MICO|nr:16S rRNA (cytosine967-C5)-methyltransferase [Leucobacter chromiiresistens]
MSGGARGSGGGQRRTGGGQRRTGGGGGGRISPARLVAYEVLQDVEERDSYANLALPGRIRDAGLDARDAGLATELAAGALRWRGRYDRIIELAAGREIERIDARTRTVLRLGAHQLLGMRTAAHAAVNESVELQRRVGNRAAAGFVNGVLRSIGRASNDEWDARIADAATSANDARAALASHPTWIIRALQDALRAEGREAELDALLAADNDAPRVSLAILPGAGVTVAEAAMAAAESGATATGPSPLGVEIGAGDPARAIAVSGARPGYARVQDQGSQLAALALTRVRPVRRGERWLDLCAGPGGKTAVLGAEALAAGARVRANEVSEHRAELVRRSVSGVADAVEVVSYDGRGDEAYGGQTFDRILVDAPCSGLGALRRRPEARWRKQPSDLPELTRLQAELLRQATAHLAPGGVLAYVTCSPHLAETRVTLDRLLRDHPELREIDARAVVGEVARSEIDLAGASLSVQLWPHRHGTDAMFIALVERRATGA